MAVTQPNIIDLPTNTKERGRVLRDAIRYGEAVRNVEAIGWGVTRYWLQGVRDFDVLDRLTGEVRATFSTPGDTVVYEEALSACQQEIGRLSRMSLKPVVNKLGMDLDGIRKSAMGHLFLRYHSPRMGYAVAKRTHDTWLVHYGTVGVQLVEQPTMKGREEQWKPHYETIPPWELMSIPGSVPAPSCARAIVRQRWVPLSWLKAVAASRKGGIAPPIKLPESTADMFPRGIPLGGNMWDKTTGTYGPMSMFAGVTADTAEIYDPLNATRTSGQISGTEIHVELNEVLFSHDNFEHLDQYVILLGEHLAGEVDYWKIGMEVSFPLGISRYAEVGSFYGHSFASSKIEMNRINEMLLATTVRNAEDYDAFGLTFVPRTSNIRRDELLRARDGGPRVATYQADPLVPEARPLNFAPTTSGDVPAKTLQLTTSLGERVMPQHSIFSPMAPRRIEQPQALAMTDEAANESRTPVSEHMVAAWNTVHRAVLDAGRRRYGDSKGVLPLVTLETAVVGVVYDPRLGGVRLDKSALPSPDEVDVTVEAKTPRDPQTIAAHLWQSMQAGVLTPRQFRIQWRLNGLQDLPIDNEAEWNAFQHAQFNIIMAYGDGVKPGKVVDAKGGPFEVHRAVLQAFMADIRYSLASVAVQEQIAKLWEAYNEGTGYPESMPPMEVAASGMLPGGQGAAGLMPMMGQ